MKDYSHYGPAYKGLVVNDDIFVPSPMEDFPADDPHHMMQRTRGHVRDLVFDDTYPYLDKSFKFKINRLFVYTVLRALVSVHTYLFYGLRIEGKDILKKHRKLLRSGMMTVCNHVCRWDMICVLHAMSFRRAWIPMFRNSFMGKDGYLMKHVGGIPVPVDRSGLKQFNEAFDELCSNNQWIHIFPESCSWKYYTPIRPFKIGAFNMAYKYNLPIFPFAISFRERTGWRKIFHSDEPLITIHIGEPIFPDTTKPRKEEAARLRDLAHAEMLRLAGIVQNPWPSAID